MLYIFMMVCKSSSPDTIFSASCSAFAMAVLMKSSQNDLLPMGAPRTRRPSVTSTGSNPSLSFFSVEKDEIA